MRGSRITKIADELGGEKIDIIPWAEEPAQFIINSLKPAAILKVSYDTFRDRAKGVVSQDQLPLAIGKAGQNVRLSARLTRYKIDVCSEEQAREQRMEGAQALQPLVEAGLLEDYLREVFLDEHLDQPWVLAAQTPEILQEAFAEYQVDQQKAEKLIEFCDGLLNEDQRELKNELVQRRLEEARQAAEAEARALEEAQQAAVEASLGSEEG